MSQLKNKPTPCTRPVAAYRYDCASRYRSNATETNIFILTLKKLMHISEMAYRNRCVISGIFVNDCWLTIICRSRRKF